MRHMLLPVLLLLVVTIGATKADPGRPAEVNANFRSVPTTVKTRANDSIELPCHHHSPHQYVRWIREGELLCDTREPDLHPPERFRLLPNGHLAVDGVRHSDTGEYACEVMTANGLATQTHAIEVLLAPSIVSVPSGIVELPIGAIFELVCEPAGVPYPMIEWRHRPAPDGHQAADYAPAVQPSSFLGNQTSARRRLIQVNDRRMAGRIECIATNGVGEARAGVDLLVLFTPEIRATKRIVHTRIGLRAYLDCESIAHPAASVHWFRNGEPIAGGPHHLQQHTTVLNDDATVAADDSDDLPQLNTRAKHVLIVKNVRDTDLGRYECRAANRIGYRGAELELTGRPMASVFKTSPLASTPLSHNLIWQTESVSPIIEYVLRFRQVLSGNVTPAHHHQHQQRTKHGRRHRAGDWTELIVPSESSSDGPVHSVGYALHGLMPATVYEVLVVARNRYGLSDASKMIRFATGGEIEVPSYSAEYTSAASVESYEYPSSAEEVKTTTMGAGIPATATEAAHGEIADDYSEDYEASSAAGLGVGVFLSSLLTMSLIMFKNICA